MDSKKHLDFVGSIIFSIVSIYAIVEGINYHNTIQLRGNIEFYQSPGFLPVIVGSAMLICSILLLFRSLKGSSFDDHFKNISNGTVSFLKSKTALKALIGLVWMGLYVFVFLQNLGFIIGSNLYLIVLMCYLNTKDLIGVSTKVAVMTLIKVVLSSTITIFATYFIFQTIFRAPLP